MQRTPLKKSLRRKKSKKMPLTPKLRRPWDPPYHSPTPPVPPMRTRCVSRPTAHATMPLRPARDMANASWSATRQRRAGRANAGLANVLVDTSVRNVRRGITFCELRPSTRSSVTRSSYLVQPNNPLGVHAASPLDRRPHVCRPPLRNRR